MRKKNRLLLIPCLVAVGALSLTAGYGIVSSANSPEGWSEYTIQEEYSYNSIFSVEERTFTVDGEAYKATAVVCYPDGSVSAKEQVALNQVGVYTVKYSVVAGDKVYADSESFLVNYPSYSVAAEKSSLSYGTPDRATTEGVMARIAQGDSLTFTKYIDFTSLSSEDYIVRGFVTPDTPGTMDFSTLTFRFTDSVDPSVYLEVYHYGYDWTYNTYVAAGTNANTPVGMHQSEGLKTTTGYGLWSYVSFDSKGSTGIVAPDVTPFYVSMDYENKQMYAQGFPTQKNMYADLDDPAYVKNIWTGFPSGKARLTISASGYTGATANLCVSEVFGISGQELKDNLYLDTDKPVVTVDEAFDVMPESLLGREYAIPDATAYDAYAQECPVDISVWYNYTSENPVQVPIKNGKFVTDRIGTYAIVYSAMDKVGNKTQAVRMVRTLEEIDPATFTIPSDRKTSAYAGEWVPVPTVKTEDVTGGCGDSVITVFAEIGNKREAITNGFRALEVGTYKVVYVATDYIGVTAEQYYEVEITEGNVPVLERDFDLYPIYISGGSYRLPEYYAYNCANGKVSKDLCEVVIKDGVGEKTYTAGDEAIISATENGQTATISVKSNGTTLASHTATIIIGSQGPANSVRLYSENYFVGEGFALEKVQGGMQLTAAAGANAFGFTFANALSARHVEMAFGTLTGATANATITITLTDAINRDNTLSLTIAESKGEAYFVVEGVRYALAGKKLSNLHAEISYTNNTFTVGDTKAVCSTVFESSNVFLTVSYAGFGDNAGMLFESIGNCPFGTARTDRVKPVLITEYENGGVWELGTIYTLHAPIAYDVYAPNMDYTLTVTLNNVPVKDVNGLVMDKVDPTKDYQLNLDQVGSYIVKYEAQEQIQFVNSVNPESMLYTLSVSDDVPPTISWKGEMPTQLAVDEVFILPEYVVADNCGAENVSVCVVVETPKHQFIMLPGNSIKMTQVGEYTIRVMVADKEGNLTMENYIVNVL